MNTFKYIAESNPQAANNLIKSYGYKGAKNVRDCGLMLAQLYKKHPECLDQLKEIHPDKDMFEVEKTISCNCRCCRGDQNYMNADGDNKITDQKKIWDSNQAQTIMVLGLIFITISVILKK